MKVLVVQDPSVLSCGNNRSTLSLNKYQTSSTIYSCSLIKKLHVLDHVTLIRFMFQMTKTESITIAVVFVAVKVTKRLGTIIEVIVLMTRD